MSEELELHSSSGKYQLLADLERAGVIRNDVAFVMSRELEWHQFESLVSMIWNIHDKSRWLLGDLLNYGEKVFGETYAQAAAVTGLSDRTLSNICSVCRYVPRSRRRKNLSFAHHEVVAYLDPQLQDEYLSKAVQNRWTRQELRDETAQFRDTRTITTTVRVVPVEPVELPPGHDPSLVNQSDDRVTRTDAFGDPKFIRAEVLPPAGYAPAGYVPVQPMDAANELDDHICGCPICGRYHRDDIDVGR